MAVFEFLESCYINFKKKLTGKKWWNFHKKCLATLVFWNNYLDDPCHSYLCQPISFPKYSPFPRKKKPNSNLSTARKKKIKTQKCSTCISMIFWVLFCFFSVKLLFRFYNTSTLHWGVFTYLISVLPTQIYCRYTVWKLQGFSFIQILREINFR